MHISFQFFLKNIDKNHLSKVLLFLKAKPPYKKQNCATVLQKAELRTVLHKAELRNCSTKSRTAQLSYKKQNCALSYKKQNRFTKKKLPALKSIPY